ncbi:group 1 glycosyltransferase [Gracilibacillus halophilus YIM-C55.5]|uniref:Group 1 glycosyltransferase n=1 Tax=Gracilibacillus halophilus YIM-C55.5 TaxID=1308866 RepID=N4WPN3_9BACI|nr:glycosyltransferase [Gracilibacillus halophilus]ENH96430.1 group 1 glycosyltransferase [Gracilibacillus halophilus YIM-C55.5]
MESALRVLHVVEKMDPGGEEEMVMQLYRNIDHSIIQFDFLTTETGAFDDEIRSLGGYVYRLSSKKEEGRFQYKRAIKEFFKGHRFYLVMHAHLNLWSSDALKAAKRVGIPVRIAHGYQTSYHDHFFDRMLTTYHRLKLSTSATNYFASTSEAANWLCKEKADQAELIRSAIEPEKSYYSQLLREKMRDRLQVREKDFVIGHVGSFVSQKNHLYLLELFIGFRRKIPQSKLVLIGEGPLQQQIEQKIIDYHLEDSVILLKNDRQREYWLQAFDVMVYPSVYEGLPTTFIEAQSAGVPILVSDVVSKEVDIGSELVHFLPLDQKSSWLSQMNHIYHSKVRNPVSPETFKLHGYHVKQLVPKLEKRYLLLRDEGIIESMK